MEDLILTGATMTPEQRKQAAKLIAFANTSITVKVVGDIEADYDEEKTDVFAGLDGLSKDDVRIVEGEGYRSVYAKVTFVDERGKPTEYQGFKKKQIKVKNFENHEAGMLYPVFKYNTGTSTAAGKPKANLKITC